MSKSKAKTIRVDKPIKVANPEFAAAMRELGRSSAASSHDSRPNRLRTRRDVKRSAIRDGGW